MPNLRLYNSLSKQKETFKPQRDKTVSIYNCGPTVYKRQHIGNMRRFLFSDFLRRTLELFGYAVYEVMNITDVGHLTQDDIDAGEDKLEKEARAKKTTPQAIAKEQTKLFFEDIKTLNIQQAHAYPRATQHIEQQISMIQTLLENGHAYQTPTGIYYDVTSFPDYGKLSGNTLDAIDPGARIEVRGEKKHPADFALWILNDHEQIQQWDSPWGRGYPGWHIECSAMSMEYLDTPIDIHTGGEDNRFPHHENEIAQAEGATGKPFVRFWMHNAHLQLEGAKLAKREGLQITLDTIREKGFSPLAFRLLVFGSHYRSKMDFSWNTLAGATENLGSIRQLLRTLREHTTSSRLPAEALAKAGPRPVAGEVISGQDKQFNNKTIEQFTSALANDLNTPEALAVFLQYVKDVHTLLLQSPTPEQIDAIYATLKEMDTVLGIIEPLEKELNAETVPDDVQQLVDEREGARASNNFEDADTIRKKIEKKGYKVEDTPSGPRVIRKKIGNGT